MEIKHPANWDPQFMEPPLSTLQPRHSRGFQRAAAFDGYDPTRREDLDLRDLRGGSMGIPKKRAGCFTSMGFS